MVTRVSLLLLGDIELSLWDNVVRLAGLLAPPDNIFLNGYHRITIDDPVMIVFTSSSKASSGSSPARCGGPRSPAAARASPPDTLSFRGRAAFRDGNTKKFEGTAEGAIRAVAGQPIPALTLDVHVEFRDSRTVRVLDTDVFKVVIVEAYTVCGDVPIIPQRSVTGPFFRRECVTTPAVMAEVPDSDDLTWTELPAPDAPLGFELGTSGLRIELTVEGVDDPIVIPALLN